MTNEEEAQKLTKEGSKKFLAFLPKPTDEVVTYDATCHCGTVQYSVALSPPLAKQKVCSCNCSNCSRHGYLLVYPARENLNMKSGEDTLKTYSFGHKRIQHKFCTNCGCMVFFDPRMKELGEGPPDLDLLGVNVRMFKGVNLDELDIEKFDGWTMWPWVGDDTAHLKL